MLTPYAGLDAAARGDRTWRLDARLRLDRSLDLSLEGTRHEPAGDRAAEHGLTLRGSVHW